MNMNSSSANNPWFGVSMALAGIIVGYGIAVAMGGVMPTTAPAPTDLPAAAAKPTPAQPPQPAPEATPPEITEADHIKGNREAVISLIEYSDFECPFCQRHHPTMQQALDEYGDEVNWIYRHFPLSFHPNAMPAAVAAECAGELGGDEAFWAVTDLIFSQGPNSAKYAGYAEQAGISDTTKFTECLESGKYESLVQAQMDAGSAAGVRGTPGTFVYNNQTKKAQYLSGARSFADFKAAIDALK